MKYPRLNATLVAIVLAMVASLPLVAAEPTEAQLQATVKTLADKTKATPQDDLAWFELGLAQHNLAYKFHQPVARDAVASLETANKLAFKAVTLAYLGSAWTLVSQGSDNPLEKIDGVMKGCELLDKAVALVPGDLLIRHIRYENGYALPDFFDRMKLVDEDINYVLAVYAKNPKAFDGVGDPAHAFLYKARILSAKNDWNKSRQYAELGYKIAWDPTIKQSLRDFLDGKEPSVFTK